MPCFWDPYPNRQWKRAATGEIMALSALEKTFGRVQALWKPVATEEAFEIVRRRLFQTITDEQTRETVCRAYADTYMLQKAQSYQERHKKRAISTA